MEAVPRPWNVDALYLHIPFCFHKCHYCDFYSVVEPEGRLEARQAGFTQALVREIETQAPRIAAPPRTIFVGGGTPTLLAAHHWDTILTTLKATGLLDAEPEFTVEANPETVTPQLAETLVRGGVNRVSIGAQTFNTTHLKTLERWHDPASVPRAAQTFQDAGIDNFNLDLIFAIPGQTLEDLDRDVDAALACGATHLSCYGLTYEPNTAMTTRLRQGRITQAPEELERAMYAHLIQRLDAEGFEHYEVSAWAKRGASPASPPRFCEHNLLYWRNAHWLGLGPGAASHLAGWRWKNKSHLTQYIDQSPTPPIADIESPEDADPIGETLMLGLRLRQGVPRDWLTEAVPAGSTRAAAIDELLELHMLEQTETHLRLTEQGLFVADNVISRLL